MGYDEETTEVSRPELERDLLSSVCHDLKAPLASITMGASFLTRVLSPEETTALRVVDAIKRAADQMNRLVASFGDLGKLQSGAMRLQRRLLDPGAIVRSAHDELAPEAVQHRVPWSVECDPVLSGSLVHGDSERIMQTLRLLTSCAFRVVPEGGAVAMTLAPDGASAARLAVAASRQPGGRPLGRDVPRPELAIARGLVELHGAHLEVRRDAERAEFAFSLPRERSAPPTLPSGGATTRDVGGLG